MRFVGYGETTEVNNGYVIVECNCMREFGETNVCLG